MRFPKRLEECFAFKRPKPALRNILQNTPHGMCNSPADKGGFCSCKFRNHCITVFLLAWSKYSYILKSMKSGSLYFFTHILFKYLYTCSTIYLSSFCSQAVWMILTNKTSIKYCSNDASSKPYSTNFLTFMSWEFSFLGEWILYNNH